MGRLINFEDMYASVCQDFSGIHWNDAFRLTCEAAQRLGFPYMIYAPVSSHRDAMRHWSVTTYPPAWQDLYVGKNHLPRNPVRKQVLMTRRPFTWSSLEAALPGSETELFHDCRNSGMRNGVVVPVHGPGGQAIAVGFACQHEDAIAPATLPLLQLLALRLYHAQPEDAVDHLLRLTPREQELMLRVAEGHDNVRIADMLNISENSIEWHLKNIYRKLDVRNRTSAVVKSIKLGLIHI